VSYPIENRLRPPVELISAGSLFIGSAVMAAAPPWIPVGPELSWGLSLALLAGSAWRTSQAWEVIRYQGNLRLLKRYALKPNDIPWSKEVLFLGMGFRWTALHTRRLNDAMQPRNRRYVEPSWLYRTLRRFERKYEHHPNSNIQWLRALMRREAWWNRWAPLPDIGGNPALHGVEPNEEAVVMPLSGRVGHTLVLGTTRVGKTRLAELLITQDIRRGDVVIAFDPKGDADLLIRMYVEARRAGRTFHVFHLGFPHISARYNPIGAFSRITEVATRTAEPLPSEGNSAAFKEFVWRFVNVLAKAMTTLGERPDFQSIYAYAVDTESLAVRYFTWWLDRARPGWQAEVTELESAQAKLLNEASKKSGRSLRTMAIMGFIRDNELRDPVADALRSVLSNDRTYFEKLVSSLYPLLEKLTTGKIADLISPDYANLDDPRPIIDWMGVINQGAVVYIGLDSLSDHEVAGAIGTAMFADLTSVAGQIYKFGVGAGQLVPRQAQAGATCRRVQRIGRRLVRAHGQQGRGCRLPGHGLHPDLARRGGQGGRCRQGDADRRQLQHPHHAAGREHRNRRNPDREVARGRGAQHPGGVHGQRLQRPDRFRRIPEPQRRPHHHRASAHADAGRPGAVAQGPGLRPDRRRPALENPHPLGGYPGRSGRTHRYRRHGASDAHPIRRAWRDCLRGVDRPRQREWLVMAGDGATIDIGVTKAITAPFKIAAFLAIGFFVILVGRMAIDVWVLADAKDRLEAPAAIIDREMARAAAAPDFMGSTDDRATSWADFITEWFYRKPGLLRHAEEDPTRLGMTDQAVLRGVRSMDFAITRTLTGSQVIAIRAAIMVSYLPWIGFMYLLAFVDGAIERTRRKFGAGRESSTVYHRAKYFQVTLATVVSAAYLWWPGDVDPLLIFVPATLACAALARFQAKYYKKYV
jgi:conjugative coupling factor TraD (TOL family)